MIKFLLILNKLGQTRFAHYFEKSELKEKQILESGLLRKIKQRTSKQCSFFEFQDFKVVYRPYQSIYLIAGIDEEENEIAILEFLHLFLNTLNKYFPSVTELDIMYNLDKVHMIYEEMVMDGHILETCQEKILEPIRKLDAAK